MPYNQIKNRKDLKYKLGFKESKPVPMCSHPGCLEEGHYPAPAKKAVPKSLKGKIKCDDSDDAEAEKYWFCLEHVEKYNSNWNFFSGLTPEEIELFHKDALIGHRETKTMAAGIHEKIEKTYDEAWKLRNGSEFNWSSYNWQADNKPAKAEAEAVKILELSYPVDGKMIKQQYRKLVKLYHPDTNGKEAEEKFKIINEAYTYLKTIYL